MSVSIDVMSVQKVGIKPLAPILLTFAGVIGALSGLGLWLLVDPIFMVPDELRMLNPDSASVAQMEQADAAFRSVAVKNYGVDYGLIGLALGVSIGLVAGGRSRMGAALMSGLLGAIFGALGGVACTNGILAAYDADGRELKLLGITLEPIAMTLLSHAAGWGLAGFGAGLGLCLILGGFVFGVKGAIGGALGGLVAATAFTLLSAYLFPIAESYVVIPEELTEKVIWAVFGGLFVGLCIALATGSRNKYFATESGAIAAEN